MAELLYGPSNSLINQSRSATELPQPVNGDGFGVGWYGRRDKRPCVFTSVVPAWSNRNLRRLAEHIASACFFAHVRAASPGMAVAENNCHPFTWGRYLWMHNGTIGGFEAIKRSLCNQLPESLYLSIEGNTNSEHAFALFLSLLEDPKRVASVVELGQALGETVAEIERLRSRVGLDPPSYCNFAVTDGRSLAAVRYVSDPRLEPISLYVAAGHGYRCRGGRCCLVPAASGEDCVILASERLTTRPEQWKRVPPNHVVTVSPRQRVAVTLLPWTKAGPAAPA